ncbi:hypothetical protein TNCV_1433271 [Trichonephila clavipes]|nr:hypothetical protein TNCV_1433271 [Trichonephila clavipes]
MRSCGGVHYTTIGCSARQSEVASGLGLPTRQKQRQPRTRDPDHLVTITCGVGKGGVWWFSPLPFTDQLIFVLIEITSKLLERTHSSP